MGTPELVIDQAEVWVDSLPHLWVASEVEAVL